MKFGIEVLFKSSGTSIEFREKRLRGRHTLSNADMNFYFSSHICWPTCVKFGIWYFHLMPLRSCDIHENRWRESHTSPKGVNVNYQSDLNKIRVRSSPSKSPPGPEGEYRYSFTLSLTLALGGVGSQRHAHAVLRPGKSQYPLYRRLGGPHGRSGRVRKISQHFTQGSKWHIEN